MPQFYYFLFLSFLLPLFSTSCVASISAPVEPRQVLISAGKAYLGSNAAEKDFGYEIGSAAARRWRWFDIEKERMVNLDEYAMDRGLVTQKDYEEFVQETQHRAPFITAKEYQQQGFLVHPYDEVKKYLWQNNSPPENLKNHPVVLVSIDDAEAYCKWRGQKQSRRYRLPTEDEWEKAARGTNHRYFPWGNQWNPTYLNSATKGPYQTTPVGLYIKGQSPYGIFDMAGNVFQWTGTQQSPKSERYLLKGCSWDDAPGICRSAARHSRLKTSRHILIGFRCVSIAN